MEPQLISGRKCDKQTSLGVMNGEILLFFTAEYNALVDTHFLKGPMITESSEYVLSSEHLAPGLKSTSSVLSTSVFGNSSSLIPGSFPL